VSERQVRLMPLPGCANSGHTHRQTRSKLRSHDLSRRSAYQFAM